MVAFDAPIDLRMPISRVRSSTAVYIDWKITRKPMTTAMPVTISSARLKPGILSGVIWSSQLSTVVSVLFCETRVERISCITASSLAGLSHLM